MASISLLFRPVTATVFLFDLWPLMMVTCVFLTPRISERNLMHSAFACPSRGGAVILIFSALS